MTSHDDKQVMNTSTSSGTTYVEKQVAEKGWPSPMNGGKRRRLRKRGRRSKKAGSCGCQAGGRRKGRRTSKGGMGGILAKALVPFGILATLKRKQRTMRGKSRKNKSRKNKSYKKRSSRKRR